QFCIVAFQAHYHGDAHPYFGYCADDAFRNHVTAHDAAEDIDQNRFHIGVGEDDLEGFGHTLLGGATAHVEEVGRAATVQLHDVHGTHGQTYAVHHAADVAIQCDIVQFPLGGQRFTGIILAWVMHFAQFWLTEQCVTVDIYLAVEAVQIAFFGNNQRVDLQQCQI